MQLKLTCLERNESVHGWTLRFGKLDAYERTADVLAELSVDHVPSLTADGFRVGEMYTITVSAPEDE